MSEHKAMRWEVDDNPLAGRIIWNVYNLLAANDGIIYMARERNKAQIAFNLGRFLLSCPGPSLLAQA